MDENTATNVTGNVTAYVGGISFRESGKVSFLR